MVFKKNHHFFYQFFFINYLLLDRFLNLNSLYISVLNVFLILLLLSFIKNNNKLVFKIDSNYTGSILYLLLLIFSSFFVTRLNNSMIGITILFLICIRILFVPVKIRPGIHQDKPPEPITCLKCGSSIELDQQKCRNCGWTWKDS